MQTRRAYSPVMDLVAPGVRRLTIRYLANGEHVRRAYLLLPEDVGPQRRTPLPLVISPHGRGVKAVNNGHRWGDLPARGRFAVVNPQGQGRELELFSWGWRGQIDDLVRMPAIVREALPWFRIARHGVYALGGSMGGQETLLLVARRPSWLRGAAAFDSATDMKRRYHDFGVLKNGANLRRLARVEIGGTPAQVPRAYAQRSPITYARQIARSGIQLQMWWSTADEIVVDQAHQSAALYRRIKALNPEAPVVAVTGSWRHTVEMQATTQLPIALQRMGLLAPDA